MSKELLHLIDPTGVLYKLVDEELNTLTACQKPVYKLTKDKEGELRMAVCFRDVGVPLIWEVHLYCKPLVLRKMRLHEMCDLLSVPLFYGHQAWGAFASVPSRNDGIFRMLYALPFARLVRQTDWNSVWAWQTMDVWRVKETHPNEPIMNIVRRTHASR